VLFLGTGAFGADNLAFPPHPHVRVKRMRYCAGGWRQKLHYGRYCLWVLFTVLLWRPRWIYASEALVCPIAWLLSFLPGRRIVYHEHDSPGQATSVFQRVCLSARRRLARRAKLCVLPNAERLARFTEQLNPAAVCCVFNCPTRDEVRPSAARVNGQHFWLFYHGSITPPQLPPSVVMALKLLPEKVCLRVVGYETAGHRNYSAFLKGKAGEMGVAARLHFVGSVPTRRELLAWCARSDLGLALFTRETTQPMAGASNKPFDYLACGLPLLVADLPDWQAMYVEPGYAKACDPADPASITAAVQWYLANPERLRAMGEAGRQRILDEWNYESQFAPVRYLLEEGIKCHE